MKKAKSLSKKLVYVLLILMTILPSLMQTVSLAVTDISSAQVQNGGDCGYHLQFWDSDKSRWSYIITTFAYYEQNGTQYPAYCLNRDLPGVGGQAGLPSYQVNVNDLINDVRIWRTAINGYPYQSPEAMGLSNKYDAFVATKQSIYCILYGTDPNTYYQGGDDRGVAIKNAIVNLVNIGRNGTQTPSNTSVSVDKVGNFVEDGECYVQEYRVNSPVETSQYVITATNGLPSGSQITNMSNNAQSVFGGGEHFKVRVPKTNLTQDLNAVIALQAKCRYYPVFYGATTIPGTQNYLLTYDPFGDVGGVANLNIKVEGKIDLSKLSADNNIWTGTLKGQGVANAIYVIKNSSGATVKEIKTGNNGELTVTLPVGSYTIEESVSPNYFIKDNNVYSFTIAHHGDNATVNIKENVVKGGFFSARKKASLNNVWTGHKVGDPVAGAIYGIFKKDGTLVAQNKSDKDGVIFNKYKLELGDYYLQEIEPAPHFQLDATKHEFTVRENEEKIELEVKNRSVEGGYVNIFKSAGGNNLWTGTVEGEGVANATYRIESLTVDGWYIDVTTNSEGKIIEKQFTSDNIELLLGKYKIYEISSPERMEIK